MVKEAFVILIGDIEPSQGRTCSVILATHVMCVYYY